jgi:Protein of unknown function (DUF3152)
MTGRAGSTLVIAAVAVLAAACTSASAPPAPEPPSSAASASSVSSSPVVTSPVPAPSASSTTPVVADPRRAGLVGDGTFAAAAVTYPASTPEGRVVAYAVEIEHGIPIDATAFAAQVHVILVDPRGWQGVDHVAFVEVVSAARASIVVTLATPSTTDALCAPLDTGGWLDCWSHGRAVLNSDRWFVGSPRYGADLADYRAELVNHEVGHGLGHEHRYCPAPGQPAPVMQQQTISLQGCRPNAWPAVTGG